MDRLELQEEFMNELKSLELEHQISSKIISRVREILVRYRKTIAKCEAIKKLGPSVLTARFDEYLQAGGWHECTARLVDMELSQGLRGLRTSLHNAHRNLDRLKCIVAAAFRHNAEERVVDTDLTGQFQNLVMSTLAPASSGDEETDVNMEGPCEDVDAVKSSIRPEEIVDDHRDSDYPLYMGTVMHMLHEDLRMKEKIVRTLGLDTTAERMDSYNTIWGLRPFVDDDVLERALAVLDPSAFSHKKI